VPGAAGATAASCARLAPQLAALLPPGAVAAELCGAGDPALLLDAERQAVQHCAPKRMREFAAGRQCARLALQELGVHGFPLLPAPDRQPVWPPSVTGSITHTDGYCAALVARCSQFRGLGVDCEVTQAVHEELWPRICGAQELAWLERLPREQRVAHAALLFSAKESFYKCQYPVTGEWLDFTAVHIELPDAHGSGEGFLVIPQRSLRLQGSARLPLPGRFRFREGRVITAIALPAA